MEVDHDDDPWAYGRLAPRSVPPPTSTARTLVIIAILIGVGITLALCFIPVSAVGGADCGTVVSPRGSTVQPTDGALQSALNGLVDNACGNQIHSRKVTAVAAGIITLVVGAVALGMVTACIPDPPQTSATVCGHCGGTLQPRFAGAAKPSRAPTSPRMTPER